MVQLKNKSWCATFPTKMSYAFMQIKPIFIWILLHQDSFWNRGKRQLENGILLQPTSLASGVTSMCANNASSAGNEFSFSLFGFPGADIVGVNCCFDPSICLAVMKEMKSALEKAGLKRHLVVQPACYHTPELAYDRIGLSALPEFPYGMVWLLWIFLCQTEWDLGTRLLSMCTSLRCPVLALSLSRNATSRVWETRS